MNRLAELRKSHKLNQQQLAKIFGVAQNTVSNWESENRLMDIDIAAKIANYFDVSLDYLLGRDTPTTSNGSEEQLLIYFRNLNDFGKKKALDALADLNDVPKYLNADTSKNKKVAARKGGLEERPLTDDEKNIINEDCQVPEES